MTSARSSPPGGPALPGWEPSLAIGVPAIDAQHQEIFARAARVEAAIGGASAAELQRLLGWLQAYALEHFADEEGLMARARYPALEAHLVEHAAFRRRVELLSRLEENEGDSTSMVQLTVSFVREWLVEHIGTSDRAFGEHLRAQGAGPEK